jgi:hypothetical protein
MTRYPTQTINIKFLLFATIFLISTLSYGQSKKFSFKLGDEYELPRKTEDLAFFGNEKDGIVNLSLKKEELNIVRFNPKTLGKTMEQVVDLDVTKNFNLKNMNIREEEEPKYHVDGYGGQVSRINGNQFIGRARIKKKLFQPILTTSK